MQISPLGAFVTFQVTFTELFIAATVIAASARRYGWRSTAVGSVVGAVAVALLALVLQEAARLFALHVLDWISAFLLLGFGLYLTYEFITGLRETSASAGQKADTLDQGARALNAAGIAVAAWALIAEGLEILVVWLGVSLREGWVTATVGVAIGLAVIGAVAIALRQTGIFRKVPAPVLDGLAAVMVIGYGIYFLILALQSK